MPEFFQDIAATGFYGVGLRFVLRKEHLGQIKYAVRKERHCLGVSDEIPHLTLVGQDHKKRAFGSSANPRPRRASWCEVDGLVPFPRIFAYVKYVTCIQYIAVVHGSHYADFP
jgi:hypothetical protein